MTSWLPKSILERWITPEEIGSPHVPSLFRVDMSEWRACVATHVPCEICSCTATSCRSIRSAHIRSEGLIYRRPISIQRARNLGARAMPPYAPRIRRLILRLHEFLELRFRDVSECFFFFAVPPKRYDQQVIGPMIPWS